MKKSLILLTILCLSLSVFAFEYKPKNAESNPFGANSGITIKGIDNQNQKSEQANQPEMREIKTLTEYFKYLPAEVHRHWKPYKAETNYEIVIQFTVHRNGTISNVQVVGTNYPAANASALEAVKSGAPYQPLPKSFTKDKVKAQIVLDYNAN